MSPVTNDGEVYIAQKLAGEATTITIDALSVYTAASPAPDSISVWGDVTIPSGGEALFPGYPVTNDPDTNNPGTVGTNDVTWRSTFGTGAANATLIGAMLHDQTASVGSDDELLAIANFSVSVTKDSSQILLVYINIAIADGTP